MLLSKEVEVNINHTNVQKYLDKGYKFDTFINSKGHISVRHGIKIIVKCFTNGYYSRYNNGVNGVLVDILILFKQFNKRNK